MSDQLPATREQPNALSLLSIIDRAARDPGTDVAKMERLLALAEQVHAREAKAEYVAALNAAQAEMRPISRDCSNPQTRSRYASYEAIDSAIRPIYTAHGFAMSFGSRTSANPGNVVVTCELSHRSGHERREELEMPADGKGSKGNDVMTRTHATGSALSYGKRYLANLVWNLSFGEADDDGNAAGQRPADRETHDRGATVTYQRAAHQQAPPARTETVEEKRNRFISRIPQELVAAALEYARDSQIVPPNGQLLDWPAEELPSTMREFNDLLDAIRAFAAKPATAQSEPDFWSQKWLVPPHGIKRENWQFTIKEVYEGMKADPPQVDRKWFWGMVERWKPEPWIDGAGKEQPVSVESLDFRHALNQFQAWHEGKEK